MMIHKHKTINRSKSSIISLCLLFIISFFVLGNVSTASAAPKKLLTKSGDWNAYKMKQFGSNAIFCSSLPKKSEGKYKKRGTAYVTITHRPKMGVYDVISFEAGYSFKKGAEVDVIIDGKHKFKLATLGETAWCRNVDEEKKLLKAMLRGNKMIVKGVSSRGTKTTDTYSLKGLTKAFETISKEAMKKK